MKLQPELQANKASKFATHVKSHELADASVNLSNRAVVRLPPTLEYDNIRVT